MAAEPPVLEAVILRVPEAGAVKTKVRSLALPLPPAWIKVYSTSLIVAVFHLLLAVEVQVRPSMADTQLVISAFLAPLAAR